MRENNATTTPRSDVASNRISISPNRSQVSGQNDLKTLDPALFARAMISVVILWHQTRFALLQKCVYASYTRLEKGIDPAPLQERILQWHRTEPQKKLVNSLGSTPISPLLMHRQTKVLRYTWLAHQANWDYT
jgi:hypothetical protein